MQVIGFLDARSADVIRERLRGFRQGLKETGYVEGENAAIVYRFAENQTDRLPELAADLIRRQVAVITTAGEDVALAARAATTTLPIIFIASQDPVKLGLVASLNRPGGNMTGINFFATELLGKRLEILRELVPALTRLAVLVNPSNAATRESTVVDAQAAARRMACKSSSTMPRPLRTSMRSSRSSGASGPTHFSSPVIRFLAAVVFSWST